MGQIIRSFQGKLKHLRAIHRMSQKDLALEMDVSQTIIFKLEKGLK